MENSAMKAAEHQLGKKFPNGEAAAQLLIEVDGNYEESLYKDIEIIADIVTENGAFLVNLDGTEVLKHFTTENSPLLDDVVQSIAIDQWTGEVYFGTAKGTISYIGDAIEGRLLHRQPIPITGEALFPIVRPILIFIWFMEHGPRQIQSLKQAPR